MNGKNIDKRQIVVILACFLGTFLLSILRVQPAGVVYELGEVNAHVSLGDAGIFASVLVLGFPWGAIASVAGLILGDVVMGAKLFIIGDLLIGAFMALFVSAFAVKCDEWKKCFVVAGMTEAIMVVGFLIYDLLIVREFQIVGVAVLLQLIQGILCSAVGAVILRYLPPMHPEKMLTIRRSSEER